MYKGRNQRLELTYAGQTKSVLEWATEVGISERTLRRRLKDGWTIGDTLGISTRREALGLSKNATQRQYNQAQKLQVMQGYTKLERPRCEWCGIQDLRVLTIDHVNNDGARDRKENGATSQILYRRLILQGFPLGYRVLCRNCNWTAFCEYRAMNEV